MYRNITIFGSSVSLVDKDMPPKFRNFTDYKSYLEESCLLLGENAHDPGRRHKLAIFSTQSRGFDTTGVNSIARKIGIDKVFTIAQSNVPGYYVTNEIAKHANDDGNDICEYFGLDCITIDRRAFEMNLDKEYLYFASLHKFDDANMIECYNHIDGACLLFTGMQVAWRTPDHFRLKFGSQYLDVVKGLFHQDLSGHGLTEIRLQSGFITVALSYIGAMRIEDIFRITASREMDPWRTDGSYDKPIPCRIATEAGVPRELFGQANAATLVETPEPCVPLNPTLRREYLNFLASNNILSRFQRPLLHFAHMWNTPIILAKHDNRFWWVYYLKRLISRISMDKWELPRMLVSLNGSIFCFCVNKRIDDYRLMMRHSG